MKIVSNAITQNSKNYSVHPPPDLFYLGLVIIKMDIALSKYFTNL
jgi:hypothetical protein